jgi:hypothetical protein
MDEEGHLGGGRRRPRAAGPGQEEARPIRPAPWSLPPDLRVVRLQLQIRSVKERRRWREDRVFAVWARDTYRLATPMATPSL